MASGDAPPLCEHRPARVNPDASLFVGRRVLAPAIAAVGRHAGVRPAGLLDSAPRHGAGSRAGAPSRSRSHSRSGPDHSDGRCAPARRSARTRTIGAIRHSPPHSTSRQTLDNAAQRRHKGTATLPMRHSQEEGPGFCQEFARAFVFLGNPPSIAQPSLASHTGRHSRHNESFTRRRRSPSLKRIHDTRTHPTAALLAQGPVQWPVVLNPKESRGFTSRLTVRSMISAFLDVLPSNDPPVSRLKDRMVDVRIGTIFY